MSKSVFHYTSSKIHVRESGRKGESRTITGYAILFNTLSAPLWRDDEEEAREIISSSAVNTSLLKQSDIKMTMFHDRQLLLARSNKGKGTLSYFIDNTGVGFSFDAPHTADGDKALELVRRGDIKGCSFAFTTEYSSDDYVKRTVQKKNGISYITYTVKKITGIYDFTLAADPAYPDTTCEVDARELRRCSMKKGCSSQVSEMRKKSREKILG